MTADAKVGLLLGLFFIVVIAFLVNGLPNFIRDQEPGQIQTVTIEPPIAPDLPLDNQVDRVVDQLRPAPLHPRVTEPPREEFVLDSGTPQITVPEQILFENEMDRPSHAVEDNKRPQLSNVLIEQKPIIHVVQSGENLPEIAKKYYGSEEGNRRAVINKLFEYNSDVIKSVDLIYVGDKIKIPSFEKLMNPQKKAASTSSTESLLDRFSDVFERVTGSNADGVSEYVVQEGETLWSIAQDKLGNGSRYSEIAKLNGIRNTDQVVAGKRLKLPVK